MGSRYLTDLAQVLRDGGLTVHEQSGWQTRARGSGGYDGDRPWVVMWHHTASDTTPANDVNYIITSQDAPLANLYLADTGEVWVIAAGATNTNGKGKSLPFSRGTVPMDSMNTHAIGIEAANSGVGETWEQAQIDAYFKINTALTKAYGLQPTDCCTHAEYAPDRKIDPATAAAVSGPWQPRSINSSGTWNVTDVRNEAKVRATPPPDPTPPPTMEEEVEVVEVVIKGANARFLGYRVKQKTTAADGTADRIFILWMEWVDGRDPLQLQRLEAYRNMGVPEHEIPDGNCTGITLLGPIPQGDALRSWTRQDFGNVI